MVKQWLYYGIHHHFSPTFGMIFWYCFPKCMQIFRDQITESQMIIGVYNHLLSTVFRFRYHSQKVIGSLGIQVYAIFGETDSICCNVIGLIPDRNVSHYRMLFHLNMTIHGRILFKLFSLTKTASKSIRWCFWRWEFDFFWSCFLLTHRTVIYVILTNSPPLSSYHVGFYTCQPISVHRKDGASSVMCCFAACLPWPIPCVVYHLPTSNSLICMVNVGKYTMHGCYGHDGQVFVGTFCIGSLIQPFPWKSLGIFLEWLKNSLYHFILHSAQIQYRWAMKNKLVV